MTRLSDGIFNTSHRGAEITVVCCSGYFKVHHSSEILFTLVCRAFLNSDFI